MAKTGTGNTVNFTATTIANADIAKLNVLLAPGQSVLNGWNFAAAGSGYNANDPAYLSFSIPTNLSRGDLHLWRSNDGGWTDSLPISDLTTLDEYASFTSTELNGYRYAVVAQLPSAFWRVNTDGLWQNGSNWSSDPTVPDGVGVAAILGSAITASRTVALSGPLTLGCLTFDSSHRYTLTDGDSLTLQVNPGYSAKIDVLSSGASGHLIETPITISSPLDITISSNARLSLVGQVQNLAGQTFTLSGGGTLNIPQGITTTGAINVKDGTLITPSLTADTLVIGSASTSSPFAVPEPSGILLLLVAVACFLGHYLSTRR